jgi:hypothetical protein
LNHADRGEDVSARVVRVAPITESVWKFEVGVEFVAPLSDTTFQEICRRAAR